MTSTSQNCFPCRTCVKKDVDRQGQPPANNIFLICDTGASEKSDALFARACGEFYHRPCESGQGDKIPIKYLKKFVSTLEDNLTAESTEQRTFSTLLACADINFDPGLIHEKIAPFKIPFQLNITARVDHEVMTNTPVRSESRQDGWKTLEFGVTRPLPTYLLAIAVEAIDPALAAVAVKIKASNGCDQDQMEQAKIFFAQPEVKVDGTDKQMDTVEASVMDCVALRKREGGRLKSYLKN